jgi:hypothetical protein
VSDSPGLLAALALRAFNAQALLSGGRSGGALPAPGTLFFGRGQNRILLSRI